MLRELDTGTLVSYIAGPSNKSSSYRSFPEIEYRPDGKAVYSPTRKGIYSYQALEDCFTSDFNSIIPRDRFLKPGKTVIYSAEPIGWTRVDSAFPSYAVSVRCQGIILKEKVWAER